MVPFARRAKWLVIALALVVSSSSARAEMLIGVTTNNVLFSFDSATPGTQNTIGSLTGLVANHTLQGIDFRPANNTLYALSFDGRAYQLYTVNLTNAALTAVGGTVVLNNITPGSQLSIDFNPVPDRLRVVSTDNKSYRINPNNVALVGTDTDLAFAEGDVNTGDLDVIGVAYTNNFANATTTTLFGYEFFRDDFVRIGSPGGSPISPNAGTTFTVGTNTGIIAGTSLGFDISGLTGIGYINADNFFGNDIDSFYTVNLNTGATTLVGSFGLSVLDIAARPGSPAPATPAPASLLLGLFGSASMMVVARRRAKAALKS